jgi:hypothetical protein
VPFGQLFSLLRQGTVQGSKSTAITPLNWTVGMLVVGILGGVRAGIPSWATAVFCACLVLTVLGCLTAFAYFAFKNPDALRSERYTLTKIAIEHHLLGDDLAGIIERIETESSNRTVILPTPDSKPAKLGRPRVAKQTKPSEGMGQ